MRAPISIAVAGVLLATSIPVKAGAVTGIVRMVARGGVAPAAAVVYAEPIDAPATRAPKRFTLTQKNKTFQPHVLAVPLGSTVDFPNNDPIYHNVFSLSKASSFDLGRYPKGSTRSVRFDRPGIVKVFCHIHSDMSAVVLVLDNPFFTAPQPTGDYEIDRIPPGRYTVVGWHERARPIHRDLTIQPGQRTQVDLAIPLEDEPHAR